jgi:magnesium and cobalt exporter, CNNM family
MTTALIAALILFTLCSGFFSGSETALFSLSSMKVRAYRRHADPRHKLIARLLSSPRDLLVTILMLNVLANILVQNIASSLFSNVAGWSLSVGLPLLLTLLFGEIIPKTLAYPNNERIAGVVAPTIGFFHHYLGPIRRFITRLTNVISGTMFFFLRRNRDISKQELGHALATSAERGLLSDEEARLITGYLEFQSASVKELMRPREEIIAYDLNEPREKLSALFSERAVSRVPVCDGELENIVGIAEAGRFFIDPTAAWRKPFFVPETMPARALMHKMAEKDEDMAIAVDEYGSLAGLITREDIVEVVVGEIADRRDERPLFTRASEDVIIASGKLEIGQLNDLFGTTLDSPMVTVGGYLTEVLGELPKAGTRYTTDELLFHVLAVDPNRVRRVYIRRLQDGEPI